MADAKCPNCGYSVQLGQSKCSQCERPLSWTAGGVRLLASASTAAPGSSIVNRYRDAYRVGTALVSLGNGIKIFGAVIGGIILIASLSSGSQQDMFGRSQTNPMTVVGLVAAVFTGVLFWVCGVLVAAQGQILRATLDTAVASSRFLTDLERADAMGVARTEAERVREQSKAT